MFRVGSIGRGGIFAVNARALNAPISDREKENE